MQSIQKTYNVYRAVIDNKSSTKLTTTPNQEISFTPAPIDGALSTVQKQSVKTVQNGMDEFFNLFTEEQKKTLIEKSNYFEFLETVKDKDRFPMNKLNTATELDEVNNIING